MVDNSKPTKQCHVDGHIMLCYRIHGAAYKWGLKSNSLCDWSVERDGIGWEAFEIVSDFKADFWISYCSAYQCSQEVQESRYMLDRHCPLS